MRRTHLEPLHWSQSGDGSTIPVARSSSRCPCSESSSEAVKGLPGRSSSSAPVSSVQVGPCDRHRSSPNSPLKSARTLEGFTWISACCLTARLKLRAQRPVAQGGGAADKEASQRDNAIP